MWLWAHPLGSLRLSFSICKIESIATPTSKIAAKTHWASEWKGLSMEHVHGKNSLDGNSCTSSRIIFRLVYEVPPPSPSPSRDHWFQVHHSNFAHPSILAVNSGHSLFAWLIYKKLGIFNVYNPMSLEISMHSRNHHHIYAINISITSKHL